ncbi:hypothetical protein B0H19DRAFT_178485 [Mycena capillaripes]|nr:hypothetical protein B0H19DRAFT_178485 [Mycena capillaripes]
MPTSRFKDQFFHPGRLEQLPATHRQVANRAAKGSLEDLRTLRDSIDRLPTSTTLRFLPAFYANLDPAVIPNMDDAKPNTNVIGCALAATEGLYLLQNPGRALPVAAVRDIWPRYWAWIEFFQIYVTITTTEQRLRLGLRELELGLREFELGSNVVQFMASFNDPTLCNLFGATPGVRVLLARNWLLLVRREASAGRDTGLDQVFQCLNGPSHLDASQPAGLEEFAEGAGGTIEDLASLIVRTIAVLVPSRKPSIARLPLKFVWAILTFVVAADHIGTDQTTGLCTALWEVGFVESLTMVMHNLAENTISNATQTLEDCCLLLPDAFQCSSRCVEEALKAGLLPALLLCAIRPGFNLEFLEFPLNGIVENLLTYDVVRKIEGALLDIEDVVGTSPLAKSKIWADFIDLAQERVGIYQAFSNCIACDNMTCAVTGDKAVFKRCICNNHYCSKQCQITDWRTGHRSVCRVLLTDVDRKESAFIRAVIHRDYELHKAGTIYPQQVRFMAQFPNSSFFTLFDYTEPSGRARIEVQPVENLENADREAWFDVLSRARDSEGPMELHVAKDIRGTLVLPMRMMNSSGVHDGLRRIAASLPPAAVALLEAVQAVLDGEKDHFRAIH